MFKIIIIVFSLISIFICGIILGHFIIDSGELEELHKNYFTIYLPINEKGWKIVNEKGYTMTLPTTKSGMMLKISPENKDKKIWDINVSPKDFWKDNKDNNE